MNQKRPAGRAILTAASILLAASVFNACASAGPSVLQDHAVAPTATPLLVPSATPTLRSAADEPTQPTPTPAAPRTDLPLAEIVYKIPLTVRHVTMTSATLFLELDTPCAGRAVLIPENGSGPTVEEKLDPSRARFLWTVQGLTPGTRYAAVLALDLPGQLPKQPQFQGRAWGPVSFRTASERGVIRIGVIGDASFGDLATAELTQEMAASNLDFVLHTGDVVDENDPSRDPFDSYAKKFYVPFEPLLKQMPVYTVIGNHDYDNDIQWQGTAFYFHAFPPFPDLDFPDQGTGDHNQYYSFTRQGIQFIMLDSQVLFGLAGREEETTWLHERLSDPRFRATIAVLHVAPFSSSAVHPSNSLPVRQFWVPLFEQARVPLVLSGHFHQYERLSSNGITYLVSGGGSSILYAPGEMQAESIVFRRQTHFILLEIDGDRIHLTAIALGGDIIDRAEILVRPGNN